MLMIAERTGNALIYSKDKEMMDEMDGELANVIEDFLRAVDVEALRLAKRIGMYKWSQYRVSLFSVVHVEHHAELVDEERLLNRLGPIKTGYHQGLRCMEGTRKSRIKGIVDWVANKSEEKGLPQSNTYWIYGLPGIGKTSLAHSICASLHEQGQLAGAFFCRRDDPNLSEPRHILPTLIYKLAGVFPSFRTNVAKCLRNDSNLTPESMKDSFFLDLLDNLPKPPNDFFVFVIDAFDECGNNRSRPALLKLLTNAAARVPWLKIIMASRPEADIQRFFDQSSYLQYDLATDQEASHDLRTFAQSEFDLIAPQWYLPTPWPEESLLNRIISRANGLFIFIRTLVLSLEHCEEPTEILQAASEDSGGAGLEALYKLYSSILNSRIVHRKPEFRRMIGVLLTAAPYRALCEETIAELAGVESKFVKKWVDDLSSLLYRDEGTNRGIRVRHLSISEFLVIDDCPCDYQINRQDANVQLGIACLKTMVHQLRFNICGLEDSRLANANIQDLPSRIRENISDCLQYSSLYWSNHLCFAPDNNDRRVWDSLEEFFEGLCPLFWIEGLSILGMVPMGAPSIRLVMSWAKVSPAPVCIWVILIGSRMEIRPFLREFRTFAVSSSPFAPPSLLALRTCIFQPDPSYACAQLYQGPSARGLLRPSRW
jgi:hypothetical protein